MVEEVGEEEDGVAVVVDGVAVVVDHRHHHRVHVQPQDLEELHGVCAVCPLNFH